jgi:hypothetical protein
MEPLIIIAITIFFGAVVMSSVTQRTPQPPQVIYIRAEQIDGLRGPRGGEGGAAVLLLCVVVLVAIWLL